MIISPIVAVSSNNAIGKHNALLWHLPNDLKFFRNTTWGMPLVMGRKTYESIAREPLPGRFNIVISRQRDYDPGSEKVWVVDSLEQAIRKASETNCKEVFIAGGGEVYALAMPLAQRIYLTRVHADFPDAEVFFPALDPAEWTCRSSLDFTADERHAYDYSFQLWERIP
jgi:dihydrofolate reductase